MMTRIMTMLLFLFGFTAAAVQVQAGSAYFGGGLNIVKLGSDETNFLNGSGGYGLQLSGGYRFNPNLSLDYFVTSLDMTDNDSDGFTYEILAAGPKIDFMSVYEYGWSPWAGLYLSMHHMEWDPPYVNQVDGFGISAAGGLDFRLTDDGVLRAGLIIYNYGGDHKFAGSYDNFVWQLTGSWLIHYWE